MKEQDQTKSTNIKWHNLTINREKLEKMRGHKGMVIWYRNQLSFFVKRDFIIYEARVKIVFNFDDSNNERTRSNKVNQYKVAQFNY